MNILPYDRFTLTTYEPLPNLLERLSQQIEPIQLFRFTLLNPNHAPYQGTLSEEGFRITRIIYYRNSFIPVVRGRFETQHRATLIHVQMAPHSFVITFLVLWFCGWYGAIVSMSLYRVIPLHIALPFLGMPILMLVVFWISFWVEANRSRRDLIEMTKGSLV